METLEYIVNKFNVDVTSESPIPLNISREVELPALFCELGFKIGAEIGVEQGKYSETLCKANPELRLYSIDPWAAYMRGSHVITQKKLDRYYAEAFERLLPYNCEIIKRYSLDIVRKFKPSTMDFVYIDGNHEFEYVIQDILQWSKIVRSGGIVSGHDYVHTNLRMHVKEAVRAYTASYMITPWFCFGRNATVPMPRDPERSWMWVKP